MASNFSSTRILNVAQFNLVCAKFSISSTSLSFPLIDSFVGVAHSLFVGGLINTKKKKKKFFKQKMKNNQKIGFFFHLDMTTTQRRE
jgi:uncharacterized membrane protein